MNDHELLKRIDTLLAAHGDRIAAQVHTIVHHAKDQLMSALDDAIASANAKVANLSSKVDAALAALAASVANQTPVTQAELDAIAAIGTEADAESAKVDAALAPAGSSNGGSAQALGT